MKVGDRVRSTEYARSRGFQYDGQILELDAVNGTAFVKGAVEVAWVDGAEARIPIPISLSDLELVELSDPTSRDPITGRPA